ncbi:MAG: di-heme oxidoredictase family protein, partial [Nannocystaceae bacterium]
QSDAPVLLRAIQNAIYETEKDIAELPEYSILANVDEEDADGDGISGRANYDRGFVGRFGRKAQTVSIEGFIRGPLNNHLGITTDPLTEEQKARLPVPSQTIESADDTRSVEFRQAAAPDEPLTDDDDRPDPEMSSEDLFDLVSWAMLLAAPEFDPPTAESLHGQQVFAEIGCQGCHVASLAGPRGRIPLYSDLLLHDMGAELGDGFEQGLATGNEFRTQPLWGVSAVAPYLHDGRADTLEQAIAMHGGEGTASADAFAALTAADQEDVITFLTSLGGLDQRSDGLLPPDAPIPQGTEPGAPLGVGPANEVEQWLRGRALFDRDMYISEGLGPYFNGDSCRACHFDPVIGGSGPLDVNVMRHGTVDSDGNFAAPEGGTILAKLSLPGLARLEHTSAHNVFEPRQTPTALGLGLIESIADATITARADPNDLDGDGIYGVAHVLDDGRVGRFSWKGGVPSVREFVRDAMSNELGMTVPSEPGQTFGFLSDDDDVPDPEISSAQIDDLTYYLSHIVAPKPQRNVVGGIEMFVDIGCGDCHTPTLPSWQGPVRLFSDLLLHNVADETYIGIADGLATGQMFRTPPLWGMAATAPYLHDGSASTVHAAILAHAGEADSTREAYLDLSLDEQALLLDFLQTL